MSKPPESLIDLAFEAGPPPNGVNITTWLIASVPPRQLTRAAKYAVPSYEQLAYDKEQGGDLIKYLAETPLPEKSLGEDILLKQQQLSRGSRRLAIVACSLAFFGGMGAFTDQVIRSTDKSVHVHRTTMDRLESDAIGGGVAGVTGGFIATFAGLGLAGRLARRPAQRLVRQATQEAR